MADHIPQSVVDKITALNLEEAAIVVDFLQSLEFEQLLELVAMQSGWAIALDSRHQLLDGVAIGSEKWLADNLAEPDEFDILVYEEYNDPSINTELN